MCSGTSSGANQNSSVPSSGMRSSASGTAAEEAIARSNRRPLPKRPPRSSVSLAPPSNRHLPGLSKSTKATVCLSVVSFFVSTASGSYRCGRSAAKNTSSQVTSHSPHALSSTDTVRMWPGMVTWFLASDHDGASARFCRDNSCRPSNALP